MANILKYSTTEDNQEVEENNVSTLDHLNPKVRSIRFKTDNDQLIDLAPLGSFSHLESLWISANKIQSIDLRPLASCNNLKAFRLFAQGLMAIDISPLSSCTKLENFWLKSNFIHSIDLSPLRFCSRMLAFGMEADMLCDDINLEPFSAMSNLQRFKLIANNLSSLNLTPFSACSNLKDFTLEAFELKFFDVTPLVISSPKLSLQSLATRSSWLELQYELGQVDPRLIKFYAGYHRGSLLSYRRPEGEYGWSFLYQIADKFGMHVRIQQDILYALGLSTLGYIDSDLREKFLSVPPDTPTETARSQIASLVVEEIASSVDRDGTTTGLHLEEAIAQYGQIAHRAMRIIELRKLEIEKLRLRVMDNRVDLTELWFTAYGYKVLSALDMGFDIRRWNSVPEDLKKIQDTFNEIGIELKTDETSIPGVEMSDQLRHAILMFVDKSRWNLDFKSRL